MPPCGGFDGRGASTMTRTQTSSDHSLAARAAAMRNGWEDDDALSEGEAGPSWTKAYVGGVKVRHYPLPDLATMAPGLGGG